MSLKVADDFLTECEMLDECIADLAGAGFDKPTQFKNWTINDVLVHLHFWNEAADLTVTDEAAFGDLAARMAGSVNSGGLRAFENAAVHERGHALRKKWIGHARDMAERWRDIDPKKRLPWIGPSMSALSSMTARQMETWAHGFEIFDMLGKVRQETDRIRNIVILGVNTFGWSHKVHGLEAPDVMPALVLTAPSGEVWEFGDKSAGEISGPAVDFAAVVTQTRALGDTDLVVTGEAAQLWMAHAQCFAGPPETPPATGSRKRSG